MDRFGFVDFWASECKKNMKKCQGEVFAFVNAQLELSNLFYKRLLKTKNGRQKIFNIKNR